MLKIHTADGKTHRIDLADEQAAQEWMGRLLNPAFQADISAVSISQKGAQYTLGRPRDFQEQSIHFDVSRIIPEGKWAGGEEVVGFFGDVRVSMLVHNSQRAARISVTRTGRRVHNPARK